MTTTSATATTAAEARDTAPSATLSPTTATPVSVEAVTSDLAAIYFDVSPDGQWIMQASGGEVCFRNVSSPDLDEQCTPAISESATVLRWSPDSDKIVLSTQLSDARSGPIVLVDTDAAYSTVVEPERADARDLEGAPLSPFFAGEKLMYFVIRSDPAGLELVSSEVDGGSSEVVAFLPSPSGQRWVADHRLLISEGRVLIALEGQSVPRELWSIDLERGDAFRIPASDGGEKQLAPVSLSGMTAIVADLAQFDALRSGDPEASVFSVIDLISGREDSLPPIEDYRHTSAGLSPSGGLTAVLSAAEPDTDAFGTERGALLSIAPTAAVVGGDATWRSIPVGPYSGSAHYDGIETSINWTEDGLFLELRDVYRVELDPADADAAFDPGSDERSWPITPLEPPTTSAVEPTEPDEPMLTPDSIPFNGEGDCDRFDPTIFSATLGLIPVAPFSDGTSMVASLRPELRCLLPMNGPDYTMGAAVNIAPVIAYRNEPLTSIDDLEQLTRSDESVPIVDRRDDSSIYLGFARANSEWAVAEVDGRFVVVSLFDQPQYLGAEAVLSALDYLTSEL